MAGPINSTSMPTTTVAPPNAPHVPLQAEQAGSPETPTVTSVADGVDAAQKATVAQDGSAAVDLQAGEAVGPEIIATFAALKQALGQIGERSAKGDVDFHVDMSGNPDVLANLSAGDVPLATLDASQLFGSEQLTAKLPDVIAGFAATLEAQQAAIDSSDLLRPVVHEIASGKADAAAVQSGMERYLGSTESHVDVNALVQWVLRESYLEQTLNLRDYAEKVKFYNGQKRSIREHLSVLREARRLATGNEAEASGVGASGSTSGSTAAGGNDRIITSKSDRTAQENKMVEPFLGYSSSRGRTALEDRLLVDKGMRDQLLAAIPFMTPTELVQVLHALGGHDMKVKSELKDFWQDVVGTMSDYQLLMLPEANHDAFKGQQGMSTMGNPGIFRGEFNDAFLDRFKEAYFRASDLANQPANRVWKSSHLRADGLSKSNRQTLRDLANAVKAEVAGPGTVKSSGSPWLNPAKLVQERMENLGNPPPTENPHVETAHSQSAQTGTVPSGGAPVMMDSADPPFLIPTGEVLTDPEAIDNAIKEWEDKLNSVGEDAQLANIDLQNALQQQQQTLQMMSNISKMLHDTAMSIIRKISG